LFTTILPSKASTANCTWNDPGEYKNLICALAGQPNRTTAATTNEKRFIMLPPYPLDLRESAHGLAASIPPNAELSLEHFHV
jgi:hypothetical protein